MSGLRIALTGATGLAGYPIARALLGAGHRITSLGRRAPGLPGVAHLRWELGAPVPDLSGHDALIHAALSHLPGRYRGGEGDDPEGFRARNLGGSLALWQAAAQAGVARVIFISSRAAYGTWPPGTALREDMAPRSGPLYGEVKRAAEDALAALGPGTTGISLRATGLYGPPPPGRAHKWQDLFEAFAAGQPVTPRAGTELHHDDLAAAILLLLSAPPVVLAPGLFNLSDFILDRRDLLQGWREVTGVTGPLPARADAAALCPMDCTRMRALGWQPRGPAGLIPALRQIAGRMAR